MMPTIPREKQVIRLFIIMTTDSQGFKNAFPPVVSFEMELEASKVLITLVYCSAGPNLSRLHQYLLSEEVALFSSNTFQKSAVKALTGESRLIH